MKIKIAVLLAATLALVAHARAAVITYDQLLTSSPALGYSPTFTLDLQANGISQVSAQAVYSSAVVANVTFQDGSQSTGSFTVSNYAALVASSATDTVTVTGVPGTATDLYVAGQLFANGIDWATLDVASNTAASIATAIRARLPYLAVSTSGAAVTLTAPLGANYNKLTAVCNDGSLTVANPTFTGGASNATLSVNGVVLTQGNQWTAATSNNATASSIASAINASSLASTLSAGASGGIVTATSTLCGLYNYAMASSNPTALSTSAPTMVDGSSANFALSGSTFTAPSQGNLTLALPVLYTSGTVTVGGLTNQTTYYAVPVPNGFLLAKYSTSAVADAAGAAKDLVVVTSTSTQLLTSEHTYTLSLTAPWSGFAYSTAYTWSQSFDNVNWNTVATSSTTSLVAPSSTTFWSFGYLGTRYLRLNTTAPTQGAEALTVTILGTP